jgi:hypothetical protein
LPLSFNGRHCTTAGSPPNITSPHFLLRHLPDGWKVLALLTAPHFLLRHLPDGWKVLALLTAPHFLLRHLPDGWV